MAKLTEYNGHFCESTYEYAFIDFMEQEGWEYLQGNKIKRSTYRDVLNVEDLTSFLA